MAGATKKSDYSVIAGLEFTFSDGNVTDLLLEFLKSVVKSVADRDGKIVIAFPGSTHAQTKDYADQFKTTISIKCYEQEQSKTTECLEGTSMPMELVGVSITNTFQHVWMIRDIFAEREKLPDISLVQLYRFISPNEALTVRTEGPNKGQVFFKTFDSDLDLGDASQFFRVGFFLTSTDRVIIWISLEYLLPIAIKPGTNELYALLPQSDIDPSGQDTTDPFAWLKAVLDDLTRFQSVLLFRQTGTDSRAAIHLDRDSVDTARVSRGADSAAIIENSDLEFFVGVFHIYDLR